MGTDMRQSDCGFAGLATASGVVSGFPEEFHVGGEESMHAGRVHAAGAGEMEGGVGCGVNADRSSGIVQIPKGR
jgi:hypothetical protein